MSEPQVTAGTEAPSTSHEVEPSVFGLTAPWFIAAAMLVVILVMIWKRVPGAIGKALDDKITLIRDQLAEAEELRTEAEALKKEYEKKSKSADKDAAALLERAKHEAEEIVAKAKSDAEGLIDRRTRIAEEKIAAEERSAIDQLRATAAEAATKAAARLIAERHDAASDGKLVDQAIKDIVVR